MPSSDQPTSKIKVLQDEIRRLADLELYDSADIIMNLFMSSIAHATKGNGILGEVSNIVLADLFELYGDLLFQKSCYRRALHGYTQSLQHRKTNSKTFRSNLLIQNIEEAQIRYKECKCHLKLKDTNTALRELEMVPNRLRNASINLCLAKLYKQSNSIKQAIAAYREVLREVPSAVEAIEALAMLGESAQELSGIVADSCRGKPVDDLMSSGWMNDFIGCHTNKRQCEFEKVDIVLKRMMTTFPRNTYLLTQLGIAAIDAESLEEALVYYKQIRRLDALAVDNMDKFACMLHALSESTELNLLANDILDASLTSPVGWIVAALYADLQEQPENAMTFLDKAMQVDPKYHMTYVVKGKLLLAQGHMKPSAVAFYQANNIQRDLTSLSGIIDAHLEAGRIGDAINSAKEALTSMPRSSTAFFIMGKVLCKAPNGIEQGILAFAKALKLNPGNKLAAAQLADILTQQNKTNEAIKCLESSLNHVSSGQLRTQLAKLYANKDRFNEAIDELHIAISLDPQNCTEAVNELARIESLLRGEDSPAALEDVESPHDGHGGGEEGDGEYEDEGGGDNDNDNDDDDDNSNSQHRAIHSRLFSDDDTNNNMSGIDRELFADDNFASDSDG